MFASIQQRYGVPPGPLIAIWGMETGFGSQRGNQNMLSSIATLAYDCRRPEFFTEQLYAALKLIDRGTLSGATRGSMHGEVGQTQFMPKNILAYGTGNLEVAADALNSTANFLKAHGWRAGAGYQPGEPNFAAIEAWNAAGVYQKAIALMGRQIDEGGGRPPCVDESRVHCVENALAQQGVMRRQEKVVAIRNRRHEVCFDRTGLGMGKLNMATQIVMDQTGDTRHEFDPGNAEALARAERRFRELTGAGFTAAYVPDPAKSPASSRSIRPRRKRCSIPAWSAVDLSCS